MAQPRWAEIQNWFALTVEAQVNKWTQLRSTKQSHVSHALFKPETPHSLEGKFFFILCSIVMGKWITDTQSIRGNQWVNYFVEVNCHIIIHQDKSISMVRMYQKERSIKSILREQSRPVQWGWKYISFPHSLCPTMASVALL